MIISASRRTDIPCYYSLWLINRLRAGHVVTRNPMNHAQLRHIPLTKENIDCIVFWTKDPANMLPHLTEINNMGFRYYFQFTLTPYDRSIEKYLRDKTDIISTFIELSRRIGRENVMWRYDPIIFNSNIDIRFHKANFTELCEKLCPYTGSVTISFVDMYRKLKTDLISEAGDDDIKELSEFIGHQAKACGLKAKACCESLDLSPYGIKRASCIDKNTIERLCGKALDIKPDNNQRKGCGCISSADIGMYNTCLNGCVYCYANHSREAVKRNISKHDPSGELLIGALPEK